MIISTPHKWIWGIVNLAAAGVVVAFLWCVADKSVGMSFLQTVVLADTLVVLWLYTRASFRLATSAEDQLKCLREQFWDEKVKDLIASKPIVFTDRTPDGEIRMTNLGDAFAANVWYLAEKGKDPVPLGSLGKGESRVVRVSLADRHVLIAEARQMPPGPVSRKFTPTINVWTGETFAHGFVPRASESLEYRGSVKGYVEKWPDLIAQLGAYDPLTHDPDHL